MIRNMLLFWLILSSVAIAQPTDLRSDIDSAGLIIEAMLGWDGVVQQSFPIPLSLLIRNDSERPFEGTVSLFDERTGKEVVVDTVVISPGSSKRLTSIHPMGNWFDCVAKFSHNGTIFWRRQLWQWNSSQFDYGANYVLFVDSSGRRLPLPGALTEHQAATPLVVAGNTGRPIRSLAAKNWQLPHHPGPLCMIRVMVFAEGAVERDLNRVQWKAIAEWMCQGGTIFVHDKSREIVDRLIELAPLGTDTAVPSNPFVIRRCGLGAIYEYSDPLMALNSDSIRQSIAKVAADVGANQINTFAESSPRKYFNDRRANKNRLYVASFFGIYSLLTGIVTFFLFRRNQKQIAGYTIFVVVGASISAGVLGGYLRTSHGDLNWLTVTQAGIGGLAQAGTINLQSAGSRNSRMAIKGVHADLQLIEPATFQFNGFDLYFGYEPFSWQRNLAANPDEGYQINVPMALWGRRQCHAFAFKSDVQPLGFELEFVQTANDNDPNPEKRRIRNGVLSLMLDNRLPFDINDCMLVVGITHKADPNMRQQNVINQRQQRRMRPLNVAPADSELIDLYSTHNLGTLGAGTKLEQKIKTQFDTAVMFGQWRDWPTGARMPPRISRIGTSSAWIVGRLAKSPIMEIDINNSDFIPNDEIHLFIQEILPEEVPDSLQHHD